MKLQPDRIPKELKQIPNWVLWRQSNGKKIPYTADHPGRKASSTDATTWSSFESAVSAYDSNRDAGVGFVLTQSTGIAAIDIDGDVSERAVELLRNLGCSYIERSPSGHGLHGWGLFNGHLSRKVGCFEGLNIEIYCDKRYMTVTGDSLHEGPFKSMSDLADFSKRVAPISTQETQEAQVLQEAQVAHKTQVSQATQETQMTCISCVGFDLKQYVPTHRGVRNMCLFKLARRLKGARPEASNQELRALVKEWHAISLGSIGTTDFAESWGDFKRAWDSVETPYGQAMEEILRESELIQWQDHWPDDYGENGQRLVRLCCVLQRRAGKKPFYLTCRAAADTLGIHYTSANSLINGLVADKVLSLITKGVRGTASEYVFEIDVR